MMEVTICDLQTESFPSDVMLELIRDQIMRISQFVICSPDRQDC